MAQVTSRDLDASQFVVHHHSDELQPLQSMEMTYGGACILYIVEFHLTHTIHQIVFQLMPSISQVPLLLNLSLPNPLKIKTYIYMEYAPVYGEKLFHYLCQKPEGRLGPS